MEKQSIEGINRHETEYLYHEIFTRRAYLRHGLSLPENAVVLDVGANIGMFSMFVAAECPTASIYAFEPLPPIYERLERNMSRCRARTVLFRCGLSDSAGEANFTYYPGYSVMSTAAIYADTERDKRLVRRQVLQEQLRNNTADRDVLERGLDELIDYRFQESGYQCLLRRLSDVVDEYHLTRIDFLKIDVQGAEIAVLDGIRVEHWPLVQQIAMEVHDGMHASTKGRLRKLTAELGVRGFRVVVEQGENLSGTDRHNLFAMRRQ